MSTAAPGMFNPLSPAYRADPHPSLHALRECDPVHFSRNYDVWVLTRYDDVVAALRNERLSASAKHWRNYSRFFLREGLSGPNLLDEMYGRWMLQVDGADHTRLRALVNAAFTPRAVERLRDRITVAADELLNLATANGDHFDVLPAFAYPLPIRVIVELLGIPEADRDRVRNWSHALLPSFTPALSIDALRRVNVSLTEFRAFFAELVARRRREPGEDVLSAMVHAVDVGQAAVSDEELFATCILLAFAGHASTVQGLAAIVSLVAQQPELFDLLRADPTLIPAAVEESLRFESPLQVVYRSTREPTVIRDRTIPAGELLFLSLPAANRDPAKFAEPDRFDIRRTDKRHVAFGYGGHFCAGAGLARLEMQIALHRFLHRFDRWRTAFDGPPKREASLVLRGLTSLPIDVERAGPRA
jgi:pimeloyl-[acyl-carrier protein] synthase